eukprot:CAMPEP_0174845288 /NCGR_PEP_ID=MMETSP1114-20130205/11642_1 /TAXON_ID=312471 /ORGANISM="Neobodo designis, Strain CCAP 1951/1" /LENGTH=118 /DNA_ID=CAMNT_0016079535 /DNA_START=228 /DNA_END=581 /DNA_ORIENTATION=-
MNARPVETLLPSPQAVLKPDADVPPLHMFSGDASHESPQLALDDNNDDIAVDSTHARPANPQRTPPASPRDHEPLPLPPPYTPFPDARSCSGNPFRTSLEQPSTVASDEEDDHALDSI